VRIVGGVSANQGSWPSIALVIWNFKGYYLLPTGVTVLVTAGVQCDGTLISTTRVLTAGKEWENVRFESVQKFIIFLLKIKKLIACPKQFDLHMVV
jgi:hypothetical protein